MRKQSRLAVCRASGIAIAAALVGVPSLAAAQDSAEQVNEAQGEVIIVTGLKRADNLQDVSVAASVLGGEQLQEQGVERLDDLQNVTPSLSISDSGLTQSVNIRGIGLASGSPNAANGVATYFDGVFQPPIVSTNSFYDIGAVEVYRGPQGTFVGSNSTGGAIFINSRDPEIGVVGGYGSLEFGNYDRVGAETAINLPVGDTLAIRMAGILRHRDSYYVREDGAPAPGYLDEQGGRLGINWEPSGNFRALLKGEIARKSTGGYAYRPIPGTSFASQRTDDIYTLNYNTPTQNDESADQITLRMEYETNGGLIIRSVSGYQNKRISNLYDRDGVDTASNNQDQYVRERVLTQEINVISPDNAPFTWIVGGYFQRNRINVDIANNFLSPVYQHLDIQNRKRTTGVFGHVAYDLTDTLNVEAGLRYSTYDVRGWGVVELVNQNGDQVRFLADPGGAENDNKLTGKIGLNWQPTPDHLLYAFVARGYKSGGFASPTQTFAPETVIDYELGWKGALLDGAVTTQFGAFYYDYKNFQLDTVDPETGRNTLTNLSDGTVKGAEASVQVQLGGFRFSGNLAYTDTNLSGGTFVNVRALDALYPGVSNTPGCPAGQPTNLPVCINYAADGLIATTAGGRMLFSPKWTYSLNASYEFDAGGLLIIPRANFSRVGSRFTTVFYDPVRDVLPAYNLLGAGVAFERDQFTVDFWASNLTKEKYVTGQGGGVNEFYGAPREYGVRLRVDF